MLDLSLLELSYRPNYKPDKVGFCKGQSEGGCPTHSVFSLSIDGNFRDGDTRYEKSNYRYYLSLENFLNSGKSARRKDIQDFLNTPETRRKKTADGLMLAMSLSLKKLHYWRNSSKHNFNRWLKLSRQFEAEQLFIYQQ